MPLEYVDEKTGRIILTHSMLKTMRRCPKQFQYKYIERLKPRIGSKPLERGKWLHSLLEAYYLTMQWEQRQQNAVIDQDGNTLVEKPPTWEEVHAKLSEQYAELFDEEKEALGDLPRECRRLFRSYLWHYADDSDWLIHEVEFTMETPFGKSFLYRGKGDMLIEDQYGLWIVDHKSHKTLPNHLQRLLDAQSALYLWALRKNGLNVQGFKWNYLRTKAPTVPKMAYVGKTNQRLSTRAIETDYPTFAGALKRYMKEYDLEIGPYRPELRRLKAQRYDPNAAMQNSEFFRRVTMEKDDDFLDRVAREAMTTIARANAYSWQNRDAVERVTDRSCGYMCSYTDLCTTELFGGNADNIRRQQYKVGDPLDYYNDLKSKEEVKE